MRNQTLTQKIQGQEMSVYDPYNLFEVDKEGVRLKDNNCRELLTLCDVIEKEKTKVNVFGLENNDLKVSMTIIQDLLSPQRYKIKDREGKDLIERVFGKLSKKFKIEDGYVYYIAPLYSITEDYILKNKIKNEDEVVTSTINLSKFLKEYDVDNKLEFITGVKKIRYLITNEKQLSIANEETLTSSLGSDNIIYIFQPPKNIVFGTKSKKEKIINLEQSLSGDEEATLSKVFDIFKILDISQNNRYVLGIVDNYPKIVDSYSNLEQFKVKENKVIPIIRLDNLFTCLVPRLNDPEFGFKYITNQYHSLYDSTDTLRYRFGELASITTIFLDFIEGNKLRNTRFITKNYDMSCSVLQSLHYFTILASNLQDKNSFC